MEELAFTIKYSNFNGRIITQEQILLNEECIYVQSAWDTGSTYTCISRELIEQLNLVSIKSDKISTSYGKVDTGMYNINIVLNDDLVIPTIAHQHNYIHQEGVDVLIGMDIISKGDFAISTYNEETCFSFRIPSRGLIDFTK